MKSDILIYLQKLFLISLKLTGHSLNGVKTYAMFVSLGTFTLVSFAAHITNLLNMHPIIQGLCSRLIGRKLPQCHVGIVTDNHRHARCQRLDEAAQVELMKFRQTGNVEAIAVILVKETVG